ncbi:MAG: lipopolysaccharide biosynthesis protein [Thermoleophilia bacterium]
MSIKKNVVANYFGAGWSALMAMAFVPLYIRYLGIEAYGLIGIFAMLQGWLWLLDMGMTPALNREMARFSGDAKESQSLRNLLRSIEITAVCIAVVTAVGIWLASNWLATGWLSAEKLPVSVVAQAFSIMGVVIGLRFVENIYRSSMIGLQRQVLLNIIASVMATLRGLGAVGVLIFVAPTIEAFFLWQGVISLATVGLFAGVVYRVLPVSQKRAAFSLPALRSIWVFALGTMAITFQSLLLTQIDKLLLSRLLTLEAFGYYAFAVVVAQTPSMVVGPVTQAFYPRFTKLISEDNQTDLIAAYHAAAQLVAVLLGSATIILVFFGHEILELWTRDRILSERIYMLVAILSFGSLLNGLVTIPHYLQLSAGWTGLIIRINIIAVAIIVPTLFWIVPVYGVIGAAWVWVSVNTLYVIVSMQLMHKRLLPSEKWRWYFWDSAIPLAAATAIALFLKSMIPDYSGVLLKVIMLVVCFFLVSLSAALAAPTVRRQIFLYLPSGVK